MFRGNRSRGFTLIELLVVIAIIAILAAILFPVFARAREKARQTTCSSNQRQIAASAQMYAQDHDETYPATATFWQSVNVDAGVLICPTQGKGTPIGYSVSNLAAGAAVGTLTDPAATLLTADGTHQATAAVTVGAQTLYNATLAGQVIYTASDLNPVHTNSVIASFADGHVATITSSPPLSGLPMSNSVIPGACPYLLEANVGDIYVNGAPCTSTGTWSGGATSAVILDENNADYVQTGTVSLSATGFTPVTYATTATNYAGVVIPLATGLVPPNASGGSVLANGTQPPLIRVYRRVGNAQWLGMMPGTNIASKGTVITNPEALANGSTIANRDYSSYAWRAAWNPAPASQYVGLTFSTPVSVKGLRLVTTYINGTTWLWPNPHLQLQYSAGGAWKDVATLALANTDIFWWCSLGNQTITGLRFYGDNTLGNNPGVGGSVQGEIIDRIEVYAS